MKLDFDQPYSNNIGPIKENIIGMHIDEASEYTKKNSIFHLRVMEKDGVGYLGTANLDFTRLNIHLDKNDIVTKVTGLG